MRAVRLRSLAPRLAIAIAVAAAPLAATGCGGSSRARGPEPSSGPDLSPALAPVAWMIGDYTYDGGEEHWVATAGVFYGVGFRADGGFELMILDDDEAPGEGPPDGTLRLYAMPAGAPPTLFTATDDGSGLVFANPAHDDPTSIAYAAGADGLVATVSGPRGTHEIAMTRAVAREAPEAADADRAFAHDTDEDRADGWSRWFADDGAMIRADRRVEGKAAVGAAIAPLLAKADLLWAPVWSRLSADGTLAATVGRARIVEKAAVTWRGSYVTVWRRDPAGWRVIADVGRGENAL
jgi:hypothetical protein